MPGKPDKALCSMGIYVFETKFLIEELKRDAADPNSSRDFGKDIIPYLVAKGKAVAHHFSQSCVVASEQSVIYWRDVGSIDAYWAANIDLTDILPDLDLYDRAWPIWTYGEITPPAKFVHDVDGRRGVATSSLISGGCVISGAAISRSLLFTGVWAHSYATVHETVALPYSQIGRGARLRKAVIDSGVIIPDGLVVGEDPELDAKRFRHTENGVTLITHARQAWPTAALIALSIASGLYLQAAVAQARLGLWPVLSSVQRPRRGRSLNVREPSNSPL
jgi:glucose-1-phosphate adenylyltransferase